MQDGNAEFAVGVDVRMEERPVELEGRRGVGVVLGEVHLGFEVSAVVQGIGVDDDESNVPVEDIIVVKLPRDQQGFHPRLMFVRGKREAQT